MVRRLAFDEYFDAGLKKWIYKYARSQYWRVASWYDLDDLIQDGFLSFAICRARYQPANHAHFMSLVKITFINHITDLANKRTRTPEVAISEMTEAGNDQELLENLAGGETGDAELMALLAHAPKEVRMILDAMSSNAGAEMLRRVFRLREDGSRETNNERLSRLVGIPTYDFEGTLRALLA